MKTVQKLSRQELFEHTCKEMEANGFEQKPLILPAKNLNIIAFLLIVPLLAVTIFLFLLRWNSLLEVNPEIIADPWPYLVLFLSGSVSQHSFWISVKNAYSLLPLCTAFKKIPLSAWHLDALFDFRHRHLSAFSVNSKL
mgnify:CR=1 FL=1